MVSIEITSLTTTALLLWAQCNIVNGFTVLPSKATSSLPSSPHAYKTSTNLHLSETDLSTLTANPEDARRLFYLWFFGGSGGGGIAVAAFPQMYSRFRTMRALKDEGPTLGGEPLGLSPLCGYPRDLTLPDLEKVLSNTTPVQTMIEEGPKDSFWAEMGYLRFEAFAAANEGCNPLTVRAVFDSLTTSTSTVEPDSAQELLERFRTDVSGFKATLLKSKATGWSAIGVLGFLLGLAGYVCAEALAKGWFPEWPGNANFPVGLVDPGVWTIPEYWI